MKKSRRKTSVFRAPALAVILFAGVLAIILASLGSTDRSVDEQGLRTAQEALRRAAVTCYALEGAYPESYEYLKENYGLAVNEQLYSVNYTIFASNLMPDITVVKR